MSAATRIPDKYLDLFPDLEVDKSASHRRRGTHPGTARGEGMPSNPLHVIARHPASYRLLMKRSAFIVQTERALRRMRRDRIGVLDLVGLPSIQITVPGRRTGIPRTTPLQYVPDGDAFLVVGSNWGSATHPAGAANLMAARQVTCGNATNNSPRRSGC
jgi:hypothetical protein